MLCLDNNGERILEFIKTFICNLNLRCLKWSASKNRKLGTKYIFRMQMHVNDEMYEKVVA